MTDYGAKDRTTAGQFAPGHPFAAAGGEAKEANRQAALAEYEPVFRKRWETVEYVQAFDEAVGQATARRLLTGAQAGAAVRAAEAWIKAEAVKLDRDRMAALEGQIAELKRELAAYRRPKVV